jgi:hypothetical protein
MPGSRIGFGLSLALYGASTLKEGKVEQTDFDGYQVLPKIEPPASSVRRTFSFRLAQGGATVLPRPSHFRSSLTLAKAAQSVSGARRLSHVTKVSLESHGCQPCDR